jgi:hypothetical protein
VLAASIITVIIALTMEAVSASETTVNFYQTTRRNNPEDGHLHTHRRENLPIDNLFLFLVLTVDFLCLINFSHKIRGPGVDVQLAH